MDNSNQKNMQGQKDSGIDIHDLISYIWGLRLWILLSLAVTCAAAFFYIKLSDPVYERTARIVLSNGKNDSEVSILSDITGVKTTSGVYDEVFILRGPALMTKVVNDLDLNTRYYVRKEPYFTSGEVELFRHKTTKYYHDNPFTMTVGFDPLYPEKSRVRMVHIEFETVGASNFRLTEISYTGSSDEKFDYDKKYRFDEPVAFKGFNLTISRDSLTALNPERIYGCTWSQPSDVARNIVNRLEASVEAADNNKMNRTNVVTLKYQDSNPERAEDILNTLILKYNEDNREYSNKSIEATIDFIDGRLETITMELGNVESNYRSYQSSRSLVDIRQQSNLALSSDMEYENQLTDLRVQRSILAMIKDEVSDLPNSEFKVIPSNIGLSDQTLNQVISNYNLLVADRNRLLANSSENNPRVKNVDLQLKDAINSIVISINNLERVYQLREQELQNVLRGSKARISNIPTQQYDLTQIERKQQVIEPLYLLLQQKKEEAQISMHSQADNARVIEYAYGSPIPIEPKRRQILLLAFLIGFCIPPVFVWLKMYLKDTVETRDDIEKVIDIPVLALLPKIDDSKRTVIENGRDLKTESIRMLRSNLQFVNGTVLHITSSIFGEGKSYVSSNLALSLAHSGKKVALLGLDLRKPALPERFPEITMNSKHSVVGFLIGKIDDPAETAFPHPTWPNLHVAFSGFMPPNPTELLDSPRFAQLMEYYRTHYDYVICDSAPMMLAPDSIIVNKYVDSTIYIVRSNYTKKKLLQEVGRLFERKDIRSPKLVLNGIDNNSDTFKYGYGYGSGYTFGYGYGYGYENVNNEQGVTAENKGLFKRKKDKEAE